MEISPLRPTHWNSVKERMLYDARVLGAIIRNNTTLRAYFIQSIGRLHPLGDTLDGRESARALWQEGLERFPEEAQNPQIRELLETFLRHIEETILRGNPYPHC